jgi:hypothetical protein
MQLIEQIAEIFANYAYDTEIIVASIRNPLHVLDAALAGADIATIPFSVLSKLASHPLTDKGIQAFLADWDKAGKIRPGNGKAPRHGMANRQSASDKWKNGRSTRLLTHPNTLTLFQDRLPRPIIVVLLMMPEPVHGCLLAGLIFSVAAITDYFDGYLARRYGLVSNLGKGDGPGCGQTAGFLFLDHAFLPGLDARLDCLHHHRTRTGRYRTAQHHRPEQAWMFPLPVWANTKPAFRSPPSSP